MDELMELTDDVILGVKIELKEAEEYTGRVEAFAAKIEEAKAQGFEVVQSDDVTLLLDLDSAHAVAQFDRVLPVVTEHFRVIKQESWPSKSGNLHVKLTLAEPQPPGVRYALEAALGSDGVRTALTFVQLFAGCNEPSILFKPKRG